MIEVYGQNGRHRRRVIFGQKDIEYLEAWKALRQSGRNFDEFMYMQSQESERPLWLHSFKHIDSRQYVTVSSPRAS